MRIATYQDVDQILRLDRHLKRDVIEKLIEHGTYFVFENNARIIAVLRYNLFWDCVPFLNLIMIEEAQRGIGIGSRMMFEWENRMKDAGYDTLMTSTMEDETAKFFYEKIGYENVGSFLTPDDETELIYRKKI